MPSEQPKHPGSAKMIPLNGKLLSFSFPPSPSLTHTHTVSINTHHLGLIFTAVWILLLCIDSALFSPSRWLERERPAQQHVTPQSFPHYLTLRTTTTAAELPKRIKKSLLIKCYHPSSIISEAGHAQQQLCLFNLMTTCVLLILTAERF